MDPPQPPALPSHASIRRDNPIPRQSQRFEIPAGRKTLYIRDTQDIEPLNTKLTECGLLTICPASLSWLIYLNFLKRYAPFEFDVKTFPVENITAPQFTIGDQTYHTLTAFVDSLPMLERREMQAKPGTKEQKDLLMKSIAELEMAYLLACQSFCSQPWITESLNTIRNEKEITVGDLHFQVQERMQLACEKLVGELGNNAYLLDEWWAKCGWAGYYPLAVVDAKFAACIILIKRLFEVDIQGSVPSVVKSTLLQHVSIRAQADIFYALFLRENETLDYTAQYEADPNILENELAGLQPHGFGTNGNVYRVQLQDSNPWQLKKGDYCFKVPIHTSRSENLLQEIESLCDLPFANVNKLLRYARPRNAKYFLVMPWRQGGDLSRIIHNLTWLQIKRISKGIAYAIYVVHRTPTRQCIIDFKPENILLDENERPVLCDMTTHCAGAEIMGAGGTTKYNDGKRVASFKFDVFSYGITLFDMLLKEEIVNVRLAGTVLSEKIHKRLDESTDIFDLDLMRRSLIDPLGVEEKGLIRRW